ncbi:putative glycosyltransferase [unidentified eubacterium SCB49]|nr:putative glycosyltransferase [unidentified eubacterium SCB49]
MKLLFIVNSINGSGGLERVLSVRTDLLSRKHGINIAILSLEKEEEPHFFSFNSAITFFKRDETSLNFFGKKKFIKNTIDTFKPTIITVCDDGLKGLFFKLIYNISLPIIYERHASKKIYLKSTSRKDVLVYKLKSFLSDLGGRSFDKVVVLTERNAEEWALKNVKVIPNPISFEVQTQSTLETKVVMAVGGHSYTKGFDRLLRSWKVVVEKYPDWNLHIYGRIKHQNIINLCSKLGLENQVTFFTPITKIEEAYLKSSIFALSSRSEGFGMVLIEAMSCGVPCVAFDCPSGPNEIINNNQNGLLIKDGDEDAFAKALLKLIGNLKLRRGLGKNARRDSQKYSSNKIINEWMDLYKNI